MVYFMAVAGSCEVVQVVALLHRDLHDDTTLGLLRYTATSLLQVEPPKQPDFHAIIKSIHKRVSGKVIRSVRIKRNIPNLRIFVLNKAHCSIISLPD